VGGNVAEGIVTGGIREPPREMLRCLTWNGPVLRGSFRKVAVADAVGQIPGTFAAGDRRQNERCDREQNPIRLRRTQNVCNQSQLLRRHKRLHEEMDSRPCASWIPFFPNRDATSIGLIADYGRTCTSMVGGAMGPLESFVIPGRGFIGRGIRCWRTTADSSSAKDADSE
jgi:hypothetical protein